MKSWKGQARLQAKQSWTEEEEAGTWGDWKYGVCITNMRS